SNSRPPPPPFSAFRTRSRPATVTKTWRRWWKRYEQSSPAFKRVERTRGRVRKLIRFRRLTLRSATGTMQRIVPTWGQRKSWTRRFPRCFISATLGFRSYGRNEFVNRTTQSQTRLAQGEGHRSLRQQIHPHRVVRAGAHQLRRRPRGRAGRPHLRPTGNGQK